MALPENVADGQAGHAGLHRDVNKLVNAHETMLKEGRLSESELDARYGGDGGDFAHDVPWPADLVAFWDFQEEAAPYFSKVGVAPFPLTPVGGSAPARSTADPGPFGPSLTFDGATKYLSLDAALTGALNVAKTGDEVTVIAWARRASRTGSAGFLAGMWRENNNNHARQYGLFWDLGTYGGSDRANGHISFTGGSSPGLPFSRDYSSSKRALEPIWHMIAMTYDGQQIVSYVDALADSFTGYTEPAAPNGAGLTYAKNPYRGPDSTAFDLGLNRTTVSNFTVGSVELTAGMGNFLAGQLGGVAVFGRALTQAELMKINLATAGTNPFVKFDMARDSALADGTWKIAEFGFRTVHGNTGVVSGNATDQDAFNSVRLANGVPFMSTSSTGAYPTTATERMLGWYDTLAGIRLSQLGKVTYDLNHSDIVANTQLAIRVGAQWYLSETLTGMTVAGTSGVDWSKAQTKTLVIDRAGNKWRKLNLTIGTEMAPAAAVETNPIPNGIVTGIGFYLNEGIRFVGNWRARNLNLYSSPV